MRKLYFLLIIFSIFVSCHKQNDYSIADIRSANVRSYGIDVAEYYRSGMTYVIFERGKSLVVINLTLDSLTRFNLEKSIERNAKTTEKEVVKEKKPRFSKFKKPKEGKEIIMDTQNEETVKID